MILLDQTKEQHHEQTRMDGGSSYLDWFGYLGSLHDLRSSIMTVLFKQVKRGAVFTLNGNLCMKKTDRTATLLQYKRNFYVGANEPVEL